MWHEISKHNSLIGPANLSTQHFKHNLTGIEVIFINLPRCTLYSSSVLIPTFSFDNKGLAHTLEHLIFCGSESHPSKGYLDLLANSCFSNGTNAYTSEDHTCYTFSSCCQEGVEKILPIFLDHIFFPILNSTHFHTEICHINEQKEFGGVVFCEMKARENSEADLCDHAIKSLLYGATSPYAVECGGLTKDIAALTLDEIVAFHKKFYHPSNAVIILAGNFGSSSVLLETIDFYLSKVPFQTMTTNISDVNFYLQPSPMKQCERVLFPSQEESIGSVVFGWRGPDVMNVEEINVLDLLLRYLNEDSTSLFHRTFVELENPLAAAVDHEIFSLFPTSISIYFSGVSNHEQIFAKTSSELENIIVHFEKYFKLGCFLDFLQRFRQKLLFTFENSAIDFATQLILPQVLIHKYGKMSNNLRYSMKNDTQLNGNLSSQSSSNFIVGSNLDVMNLIEKIKERDENYFIATFKKYINHTYCQVKMIPSEARNVQVQNDYNLLLKESIERSSDFFQLQHDYTELSIPNSVIDLSSLSIAQLPQSNLTYCSSFGYIQSIIHDSEFFNFTLCIPLKNLTVKQRKYLLLFQELFFQSSISKSAAMKFTNPAYDARSKKVKGMNQLEESIDPNFILHHSFQDIDVDSVIKVLSEKLVNANASVGMDNDTFSCNFLSDYFIITASCVSDNISFLLCIILNILFGSQFVSKKVHSVASNLLNDLIELKREPEEMLDFLFTKIIYSSQLLDKNECTIESNEIFLSLFCQESLLKMVKKDVANSIIALEELKAQILQNCINFDCILQLGIPKNSPLNIVEKFISLWNYFSQESKFSLAPSFEYPTINFQDELKTIQKTFGSNQICYKMNVATASYLMHVLPISINFSSIKHNPTDYYSLVLICQLLGATEGPLYSRIRGDGLAYRVNLSVAIFSQQIIFSVGESVEPQKCLESFHQLLVDIQNNPSSWFNESTLATAKSCLIYQIQENRNSPVGILNDKLKDFLANNAFASNINTILHIVTPVDLIASFSKYFLPFLKEENCLSIAVTPEQFNCQKFSQIKSLKSFYF